MFTKLLRLYHTRDHHWQNFNLSLTHRLESIILSTTMSAPQNETSARLEEWDCNTQKEEATEKAMIDWMKWESSIWDYQQIRVGQDVILRYAACVDQGALNIRAGDAGEDERKYSLTLTESSGITLSDTLVEIYKEVIKKYDTDSRLYWVNFCNISNETVREHIESLLPTEYINGERVATASPDSTFWSFLVFQNPFMQSVEKLTKMLPRETGESASIRKITVSARLAGERVDKDLIIELQYND